jgi:hypothetical protein
MEATNKSTSGLRIGIIVLALATAAIHLFLALRSPAPFSTLFILNTLGYAVLLAAYLMPQLARYHGLIRWAFIAFAALTVILYFAFNASNFINPVGLITKAIEIALIVLLWLDGRNA